MSDAIRPIHAVENRELTGEIQSVPTSLEETLTLTRSELSKLLEEKVSQAVEAANREKDEPPFDVKNPKSVLAYARGILDPRFIVSKHHQNILIHQVVDRDRKIVAPIYEGDGEKIIENTLSTESLNQFAYPLRPGISREMTRMFVNHAIYVPMPKPMALPDELDIYCLHRPDFQPSDTVAIPSWMKILKRMSEGEAFAAWIWGVYTDQYKGRQMLWLHGEHGEDGKSMITKVLSRKLFGHAHKAITNAVFSGSEKRFLTSFFEDAQLVTYPDANNKRCLMSEAFKNIASGGSDDVLIERKGKQAYRSSLRARMWICSNFSPDVTDDNFVKSRLLYIGISKMVDEKPDPEIESKLIQELPGFLHYAKMAYEKGCSDNYKIGSPFTDAYVEKGADDFYEDYQIIFSKYWEIGTPDDYIVASKVRDITRQEGIRCNTEYKKFTEWLEKKHGVIKRKISSLNGVNHFFGMRKRRARPKKIDGAPPF